VDARLRRRATWQLGLTAGVAVLDTAFFSLADNGFTSATGQVMWIVAGLWVVSFLLSFLLPRRSVHV
jgi:hypothetical protein